MYSMYLEKERDSGNDPKKSVINFIFMLLVLKNQQNLKIKPSL